MKVHAVADLQLVRAALLCVTCDLPARKKVCGFMGHTASLGCSRCLKSFSGAIGSKDYSGFKRAEWRMRTIQAHHASVDDIRKSRNKTEHNRLESLHGCRYSVLLELPYFNLIKMLMIDPMHNLFLGSVKYVMKNLWIDSGCINSSNLQSIQACIDSMCVPSDVGRIPGKW